MFDALNTTGLEASRSQPCPLCDRDHYCYLVQSGDQIIKAICQWTEAAPEGWDRTGTAKDGRGIFTRRGVRGKRRNFPDFIQLQPKQKNDIPKWLDYMVDPSGHQQALGQAIPGWGDGKELEIQYLYPNIDGTPNGKIVRRQWTDRRRVYENGRKTKQVRPWHWVGSAGEGFWSDRGKGDKPWTLYRETEAKEDLLNGDVVFVVAGEQAVECLRELGLTATTCQGGEANWRQILDRLKDTVSLAKEAMVKPVLAILPDYDLTGEIKFSELLKECDFARVPAVLVEPLDLWAEMPVGGDIWNFVHQSGLSSDAILRQLEVAVDAAIDRQEQEILARKQRQRWQAPEAWHGELGQWKEDKDTGDRQFRPQTDFDFQIERELISEDGGGLVLQVKQADSPGQKRVFLKSSDYSSVQKFVDALKRSLGGGIVCNLSNYALQALIRVRLHEYRITRRGKAYRLVDRVGQQSDGTWVFKGGQFDAQGEVTTEEKSLWVWNPEVTGDDIHFKSPTIAPASPEALRNLIAVMQRAFGSDFYPALLTLGYAAAGVHYQEIQEREGAFPILNLYGDPGSGKTTAAECALSLVGQHKEGMMVEVSVSAAYERLKLAGSLLHCLDDPKRDELLDDFLKGFYNAKARVVRGGKDNNGFNTQKPHSPLMVTSNHACGENSAATQSRLIRLFFTGAKDGDRQAFRELPTAQNLASGCFTDLVKLGYPAEAVYNLEQELVEVLPNAHIRIAKSLALLLCYSLKIAELASLPIEPLKRYVLDTVCAQVNDPDESGDSLRDFLEKIFILQSETKIGEWNIRWVEKGSGKRVLAIYLPGVWSSLDKEFKPSYNRKIIESLLGGQGIEKTRQFFHATEDQSRAYERAKLTASESCPPNTPDRASRWCYELPDDFLRDYSAKNVRSTRSTRSTSPQNELETPAVPEESLLISLDQQEINTEVEMSTDEEAPTSVDQIVRSTAPSVDLKRSTEKTLEEQGFEAPSPPLVDLVDLNCAPAIADGDGYIESPYGGGTPPRQNSIANGQLPPPFQPGDRVRYVGSKPSLSNVCGSKVLKIEQIDQDEAIVSYPSWAVQQGIPLGDLRRAS